MGQRHCLSVGETLDVPFTWPGALKKSSIKGKTGHCSVLPRLENDGLSRGTLGHPQSPIKEKSDPPGRLGIERVVQSMDCLSVGETWDVLFTWPGALKKSSIKGQTGHCSAPARKWRAIPGHPGSFTIINKGEVWSSWVPGARAGGTINFALCIMGITMTW